MPAFLADHNFKVQILDGLRRKGVEIDVLLALAVGPAQSSDHAVLDWATENDRVVLTHDKRTLVPEAIARVGSGLHLPGVVLVDWMASIGTSIDELELRIVCLREDEWEDQVRYLP